MRAAYRYSIIDLILEANFALGKLWHTEGVVSVIRGSGGRNHWNAMLAGIDFLNKGVILDNAVVRHQFTLIQPYLRHHHLEISAIPGQQRVVLLAVYFIALGVELHFTERANR